jgi:hypothetical protein
MNEWGGYLERGGMGMMGWMAEGRELVENGESKFGVRRDEGGDSR